MAEDSGAFKTNPRKAGQIRHFVIRTIQGNTGIGPVSGRRLRPFCWQFFEPTAGWIIFTSSEPLLDGSNLRIPHTRVLTTSGEAMEMKPRKVDLGPSNPMAQKFPLDTGRLRNVIELAAEKSGWAKKKPAKGRAHLRAGQQHDHPRAVRVRLLVSAFGGQAEPSSLDGRCERDSVRRADPRPARVVRLVARGRVPLITEFVSAISASRFTA